MFVLMKIVLMRLTSESLLDSLSEWSSLLHHGSMLIQFFIIFELLIALTHHVLTMHVLSLQALTMHLFAHELTMHVLTLNILALHVLT